MLFGGRIFMKKLLFILFTLMTFVFSGCTPKITGDEKTA